MADKISTLILTVDLECGRCYKKIRKVIAKFPEIQSQIFDEKNNKVFISGPFDPEKLKRKLCCKACKYIKDIQIKPPKPKQDPPKQDPPPPPRPLKQDPPPIDADPPPVPPKPDPAKDPDPPKGPPKPVPTPPKPVPPPPEPVLPVPGIPVGPYAPMVCCRPCYEGYPEHGICTRFGYERGTCNCKFGYERGTCHCKFFSEEDPSCRIM